jgi:hypothetical protein
VNRQDAKTPRKAKKEKKLLDVNKKIFTPSLASWRLGGETEVLP